jgi:hypothetical protein
MMIGHQASLSWDRVQLGNSALRYCILAASSLRQRLKAL